MLCTPWSRNPLTFTRLSVSAASGLGDNFSLGTLKNDFAALIYKYLTILRKLHILLQNFNLIFNVKILIDLKKKL
jgi:hypothetical protein